MAIGIYFGTQTTHSEVVAGTIKTQLGDACADPVNVEDVSDASDFAGHDGLICIIPTWNTGEETNRSGTAWDGLLEGIGGLDMSGKPVAICGLGDAAGYADNFVDALEELHMHFKNAGAMMVGYVSTDGYTFTASKAQVDDKFCGCPIDEDGESELTEERLTNWCNQLKSEMGI